MSKVTLSQINHFLETRKMAIAGVSRDKKKFGNMVFHELLEKGFDVCPINPHADAIDGVTCYRSVDEIPEGFDRLLVVTPKEQTLEVLKRAKEKGIKYFWLQQDSESPETIDFIDKNDLEVISKKCIYMFANPVKGGHKFHRGLVKIFGGFPKN
jgi:uncharacterized protein